MLEKNRKKNEAKKQRCLVPFNTGVRTMKTVKDYNRQSSKKEVRKLLDY